MHNDIWFYMLYINPLIFFDINTLLNIRLVCKSLCNMIGPLQRIVMLYYPNQWSDFIRLYKVILNINLYPIDHIPTRIFNHFYKYITLREHASKDSYHYNTLNIQNNFYSVSTLDAILVPNKSMYITIWYNSKSYVINIDDSIPMIEYNDRLYYYMYLTNKPICRSKMHNTTFYITSDRGNVLYVDSKRWPTNTNTFELFVLYDNNVMWVKNGTMEIIANMFFYYPKLEII